MTAQAERGMSAPPEVVFNTATDPDRLSAWLPAPLRGAGDRLDLSTDNLRARWSTTGPAGWSAELRVGPVGAGGASVRLSLDGDPSGGRLEEVAEEALASLAREVADNLTAG
jgi:carbon monoxide dehydrogenase subunit G